MINNTDQKKQVSRLRHDLRTPLNAIIGYSEMILEDIEDSNLDYTESDNFNILNFIKNLKKIHATGTNMAAKVNEILDSEKIIDFETIGSQLYHEFQPYSDIVIQSSKVLINDSKNILEEDLIDDIEKIYSAIKNFMFQIDDFSKNVFIEKSSKSSPSQPAARLDNARKHSKDYDDKTTIHGGLLVVDDNEMNRDILCRHLERQGYMTIVAEDGYQALEMVKENQPDLVLLDIMMPGMDGYQVLQAVKENEESRAIPVIMISALDEMDSVVRCIEMGAEDYLPKPFDPVLLKARIGACLEKKRLRDMEQAYLKQLKLEQEKSERLLLNILPRQIAERLKQEETTISDNFEEATVLFIDIVGFTSLSSKISPKELVALLNTIFSAFDKLAESHGLEKIKTIGDAYMVVGGIPVPGLDHAENVADMALDVLDEIKRINNELNTDFKIRVGINTGPVVAGVIGTRKFSYDLWGETVNIASRMESHGITDCIQVSPETYKHLNKKFIFKERGMINIKGKGEMNTYLLTGRKKIMESGSI
ncbi:Two component system response regulator/histidine kinase, adenyl cyclase domain-containing [Desulfonema limicola]|uniref:Adenylate cyclase n=1 Tax=Desulfonema limicola TaxID=45656 RepID=A0A975B3U5_9BACT|nr:adenylate/guanylate cyclase domain-containing protein [Desulfonema limicola]QTA78273.1 Two component system response regulator/histidine kinase, adenyl cyclase domain-containing [Desulfonema limicola]